VELTGENGGPLAITVNDDATLIRTARWVADLLGRATAPPIALVATDKPTTDKGST